MTRANVAATFMEHLCECPAHGYSQEQRWGNKALGICEVECEGITGQFYAGDRDCSSAVIDAWNEALKGTGVKINASYTGDMVRGFLATGLFESQPMSFTAQRGDVYMADGHTAMCLSAVPDMLGEFSINENGEITGGEAGDQTGNESRIRTYYNGNWNCILHYIGETDPEEKKPADASQQPRYRVYTDHWLAEMVGMTDTSAYGDDFAGILGQPIIYVACDCAEYRSMYGFTWLPYVHDYDCNDYINGFAGKEREYMTGFECSDNFQLHEFGGDWLQVNDSGHGNIIDGIRIWR